MSPTKSPGPVTAGKTCMVIIPAHNEEADIGAVVNEIFRYAGHKVVVVDDASTDRTAEVARRAGAQVIPLPLQLGAWGAVQTGIRYACQQGFDYAITMDADGQHEPLWMESLLEPVTKGEADVVIGCCTKRGSRARKLAWRIMKGVSGLTFEDLTSGFRSYNAAALRVLAQREANLLEYQDVGVLVLLQASGLRIHDIEVTMLPRRTGSSRVYYSWLVVFYYMCHTLLLGFSKRGISRQQPEP